MTPADFIDRNSTLLLRRLQQLVRTSTVNPPGENYDTLTANLAQVVASTGLQTKRYEIPAKLLKATLPPEQHRFPRYNIVGKLASPGAKRTLHFNAHYDVVPVSGKWRHGSPFSGTVDGGWIYGRGTADMKGSIASLLLALHALRATHAKPKLNIEVSFTADEETDSQLGTGWLVQNAPINPDYAIVMEGGEKNIICCGHNGVVWLEVAVQGKAAHGSRPDLGINALEKMSALILGLDGYKGLLARRKFTTPEGKTMAPTINIGGVFGQGPGGKINTVPALASFSIDRRVIAVESHSAAERELREALAAAARKIPQCRITVNKVTESFSCFSKPTHPLFTAMQASVTRVRRAPTKFGVSTGFNDMAFFAHHLKIPTLGYGPGGEAIHAVDERAPVKELINAAKIYADLLMTFSG